MVYEHRIWLLAGLWGAPKSAKTFCDPSWPMLLGIHMASARQTSLKVAKAYDKGCAQWPLVSCGIPTGLSSKDIGIPSAQKPHPGQPQRQPPVPKDPPRHPFRTPTAPSTQKHPKDIRLTPEHVMAKDKSVGQPRKQNASPQDSLTRHP